MMGRMQNKRIVLASRPTGMPSLENFRIEESEVPQPKEGEVLVRTLYLSVDPYMRSRMNEGKSYVPPFEINGVITGGVLGEVVESRSPAFQPGAIVTGYLGWQIYQVARAEALRKGD